MMSFTAFALNLCNKKKISLWLEDMKVPYAACSHHFHFREIHIFSLRHREISYIYYHTHQFVGLSYYIYIYIYHKKIKFIPSSHRVIFFLFYRFNANTSWISSLIRIWKINMSLVIYIYIYI